MVEEVAVLVPELVVVVEVIAAVVVVAVVDEEELLGVAVPVVVDEELSVEANPPTSPRPRVSSCAWYCELIQLLTRVWF